MLYRIKRFLDRRVIREYSYAAREFASAKLEVTFQGPCVGYIQLLEDWKKLEHAYAELGYRPIPLVCFNYEIPHELLGRLRNKDEKTVYYATAEDPNPVSVPDTIDLRTIILV